MKTNPNKSNAYLEIIFANRNKEFGSYELRKNYSMRMRNGLLLTITTICLLLFATFKSEKVIADKSPKSKGPLPILDTIKVHVVKLKDKLTEPPKINPKVATKQPNTKITENFPKAIVADDIKIQTTKVISKTLPNIGSIATNNKEPFIPNENEAKGGIALGVITSSKLGESGKGKIGAIETANAVDEVPIYPGGERAMQDFLGRYLEYPELAKEKNEEAKIEIFFVVYEDGSVQQISAGSVDDYGFASEGKRVISKMPKWKPAMVAGKPVKCYFSVPITFQIEDNP